MKKRWVRVVTNKYFIATVVFLVIIVLFDGNNVIKRRKYSKELRNLKSERDYYREKIAKDSIETIRLSTDLEAIERYGREVHKMKRANEDIYIIKTTGSPDKKQ